MPQRRTCHFCVVRGGRASVTHPPPPPFTIFFLKKEEGVWSFFMFSLLITFWFFYCSGKECRMTIGSMVQDVAYFNCPCIHHLSPNICYGRKFCSFINESNFQKQQATFCYLQEHTCIHLCDWLNLLYDMYFLCGRIHIRYKPRVFEMKIGVEGKHFNICQKSWP